MQVFKLFYKIVKNNLPAILISFIILITMTLSLSSFIMRQFTAVYEEKKIAIAVFDHDEASAVTDHFVDYLSKRTEIIPIEEDPEAIADALFDMKIDYVLTIPEGFGEALIAEGESLPLRKRSTNAQTEMNVDTVITAYLTNAHILAPTLGNLPSDDDLHAFLQQLSASLDTDIEIVSRAVPDEIMKTIGFGSLFTPMLSYVLTANFITIFGYAIISLRQREIMMRNRLARLSQAKQFVQLLLGCFSFSLLYWGILMIVGCLIYGGSAVFSQTGLLLMLSSFLSMMGIFAFAYFICTLSPNKGIISFLANFLSLFIAFSSGIFAPREFLPTFLQHAASIVTPIWQVRANELILSTTNYTAQTAQTIQQYFGIMLLIITAYFALSFAMQSYRHRQNIYL